MAQEKKVYDLFERALMFAERIRNYCLGLPKNVALWGVQRICFDF
jgi:hypothetical protein